MVELIVTIVILGIIATVAGPKFFSSSRFAEMGFADTATSAARYAHKLAMASGCATRLQVTSGNVALFQRATSCTSGSFTRAVKKPGGENYVETVPSGVSVSAQDIYFDSKGRPHAHAGSSLLTSAATFTVGSRTVTIEAETGYVH